jgi:hypothetical protein
MQRLQRRTTRFLFAAAGAAALLTTGFTATAAPARASGGQGHSYYVSVQGSDAGNGLSPGHAFRHIQRCADVMVPGDTCHIMTGTYRETVRPARSGSAGQPISYVAAPGAKVTVDGTEPVTGWHQVTAGDVAALAKTDAHLADSGFAQGAAGGHIYVSHVTLNPALSGNQVFYDGHPLIEAQWPYPGTDPMTPNVEHAGAGTTNTMIADPKLTQPAGYWDGAQVYTEYWFISQTGTVSASQPGSVTVPNLPDNGSCVGLTPHDTRYYLFGQLKMLTHPGEWFYDASGHQLYIWPPAGSARIPGAVDAQQRTYGFDLDGISHTRIVGLGLFADTIRTGQASTGDILNGLGASYVSAYDTITPDPNQVYQDVCSMLTAGETTSGLVIEGTHNQVLNSTIAHSAGNGIALLGHDNSAIGNVIHDVDSMGSYAAGVNVTGDHQMVAHNTIYRTGRSGITTDWHVNGYPSTGNRIAYNNIWAFDRLNVDAAAIYVCCTLDMTGTRIDHNWLHDPTPLPGVDPWAEAGFYTDTSSSNATVYDNVGWGDYVNNSGPGNPQDLVPVAIFINGGGGNKLYNNDGPVQGAYNPASPNTVENNIGTVYQSPGDVAEPAINHNLPSSVNPQYVDPIRDDYQLRADSPARNAGVPVPGVTAGGTDPTPSLGAYQYGGAFWQPGAELAPGRR